MVVVVVVGVGMAQLGDHTAGTQAEQGEYKEDGQEDGAELLPGGDWWAGELWDGQVKNTALIQMDM